MTKVNGFIDGFNLYHALSHRDPRGGYPYKAYRWLDYWKLVECFLYPGDSLEAVYYFTAYAQWNKGKKARHSTFTRVLKDRNVTVVLGRFRMVTKTCHGQCRQKYTTFEEKRTDVNIAASIIELAVHGAFEKAILISADSDLIPALQAARRLNNLVKFSVVKPIGLKGEALSNAANYTLHMNVSHLKKCLLPQTVTLKDGSKITAPQGWI